MCRNHSRTTRANIMSINLSHIIPMFLEITAGTITLTTLFVVIMKIMMNEEFEV